MHGGRELVREFVYEPVVCEPVEQSGNSGAGRDAQSKRGQPGKARGNSRAEHTSSKRGAVERYGSGRASANKGN